MVLVEPDPFEAERLRKGLSPNEGAILPFALWRDEGNLTLNLSRSPGTSSVYPPNMRFLAQFPEAGRFDVVKKLEIPAKTIDGLARAGQLTHVDFAKIDVQGAELAILEGGRNYLAANLVGLELEVEFAELYVGQPLFSDVEAFVRKRIGLELWDLRKSYWKYEKGRHTPGPVKGRLIFGDALFLRPPSGLEEWIESMSHDVAKEKVTMLVVTALAYGYVDYASALLETPALIRLLDASLRKGLQCALKSIGGGFRPLQHGNGLFFVLLNAVARSFQPTHAGWASQGQGLGSRRHGPFWF